MPLRKQDCENYSSPNLRENGKELLKLNTLNYLNGTSFCLVRMTVLDEKTQKVKLSPIHGTAKVLPDRLVVVEPSGTQHVVPDSAIPSILPSDGTELLKDADHYVIVKIAVL